jgi:hypothetical protein
VNIIQPDTPSMTEETKKVNYLRKTARILLKIVLFLFLFLVLVFILILTPPVQRFMTSKVEHYLQNKLKTRVEIGSISFGLSGKLNLENIYIEDQTKDTLIAGGSIKSHISFLKLLSHEIQVKDIELQNITAKIKRILPDTVFNYQFIINAFTSEQKKIPDTAQTAPLKLNVNDLALENIRILYTDVVTGSDMLAQIGNLSATIDTLDPYTFHFDIPSIIARNVQARIKQSKPLVDPEPLAKDVADAAKPPAMKLALGTIDLSKINVEFDNDVSAFYSTVAIGQLKTNSKLIDLQNNKIYLDQLALNNSKSVIRLGRTQAAKVVEKEAKQEVEAQKAQGWDFKIDKLLVDNNTLQFDNDNAPRLQQGLDYAHLQAKELTLHVDNFVLNTDSVAAKVTAGSVKEKSGLVIDQFQGNLLYANNQSYLKDLYIKTPGTEIKRNLLLEYPSIEALQKKPSETVMNIELINSHVQVKDILLFAPQLRNNPALANPNDIWNLNIVGSGTLNRLHFESLKFSGLKDTRIDAQGTLVGLMNPKEAGGNFTIRQLHTNQTDLALFTGQRLTTPQLKLPESFDLTGTVNGNAGKLNTDLTLNSTAGYLAMKGSFSNLTSPSAASYTANIRTRGLKLGAILRQPDQIGTVSGNFTVAGHGLTPNTINTKFNADVTNLGYNNYQYHNLHLDGSLKQTSFVTTADINDPNIDLNLTVSGNFGNSTSFNIEGRVDSVKTLPLHFTTQPLTFRGQINGKVANVNPDYLNANILITNALFVSNDKRLPMDTIQLVSGRNDAGNFMHLTSDVINAHLTGQYRLSDLGSIMQSSIQPYFSVTPPSKGPNVKPYDFKFTADVTYNPIFTSFMPTLTAMEPLHMEGNFATNTGMNLLLTTAHISFNGNDMKDLNLRANTSNNGLNVNASVAGLKSGNSLDIHQTRINAIVKNNIIDFSLGIDDVNAKNKYFLSGTINQPSQGTYALHLKPDSLLLNYEKWTTSTDNILTIGTTSITANNFILQKGTQQFRIASLPGTGTQPLQATFTDFRLATITGFIKSDSILADGVMNGTVTFRNIMEQPLFSSNLTINDLSLRKDTIGNVNLQVSNTSATQYKANITITGRGNDVALTGDITQQGKDALLDLNLAVRRMDLKSMQGALATAITNASGTIDGSVRIQGTLNNPNVRGELNFNKTSFAITMLGSQFYLDNEKLTVTEDGLIFKSFSIKDSANNTLNLNGTISTTNFVNYRFNLYVNATNFLLLNSTKQPHSMYYGRLNISSDIHLSGTEATPVLDGALTINNGTNFTFIVPQEEPGVVDREGIVQFVNMRAPENDSLFKQYDSLNYSRMLGMDVAVNIELKKEAIFNIIMDEANGDFLNVRGEALISSGIDPSGKITMAGNYQLEEGAYQLSFNFLKRRFDIEKGSKITWTGSPMTAQLAVNAIYVANTAPIDLVQDQIAASTPAIRNTYMQKLPFEVHLNLTGELLQPKVAFDIILPENKNYGVSNDIITNVQSRLAQIRSDEGEVNKQVFSLLLLNRFVGQDPFKSSGGGFSAASYARQSASKLLTEQLNNLAGSLIQGVDINFDVASTDDYTTGERRNRTDLNVGVSKRLLNDRLQVVVGSNFELEAPQSSSQKNNNIAGDVTVNYQLSKDGRYMLRFYRKNEFEGAVSGYIIETGLGFILNVDYNKINEILQRKKQKVTQGTQQNGQRP